MRARRVEGLVYRIERPSHRGNHINRGNIKYDYCGRGVALVHAVLGAHSPNFWALGTIYFELDGFSTGELSSQSIKRDTKFGKLLSVNSTADTRTNSNIS